MDRPRAGVRGRPDRRARRHVIDGGGRRGLRAGGEYRLRGTCLIARRSGGGEAPPPGRAKIRWREIHEGADRRQPVSRNEEHTSELQSRLHLVCRLLLEKKK